MLDIIDFIKKQSVSISYNTDNITVKTIAISSVFLNSNQPILVIEPDLSLSYKILQSLISILGKDNVLFFPFDETIAASYLAQSKEMLFERVYTLSTLLNGSKKKIIVCNVIAALTPLVSRTIFSTTSKFLALHDNINYLQLIGSIRKLGYLETEKVEQPGCFAIRGGIIDIYPLQYSNPIRIEFFGNKIESLREFSSQNQLSIKTIDSVNISLLTDYYFTDEQLELIKTKLSIDEIDLVNPYKYYNILGKIDTILSYLTNPIVFVDNKEEISLSYKQYLENQISFFENKQEPFINPLYTLDSLLGRTTHQIYYDNKEKQYLSYLSLSSMPLNDKNTVSIFKQYLDYNAIFTYELDNQKVCIENFLALRSLSFKSVTYLKLDLLAGVILPINNLIIITPVELFNSSSYNHNFLLHHNTSLTIASSDELKEGDYVVHDDYGIGIYKKIETKENNGIKIDYIVIQYADGGTLSKPISQISSLKKYTPLDPTKVKLGTLFKNTSWNKTKAKVKNYISLYSDKLRSLYLERIEIPGFSFIKSSPYQNRFEQEFLYPLTTDQDTALKEIYLDMEASFPMDRLLCGDVGFGKTEVALRAAFKAVSNKKQVAFVVPTTLLGSQHYKLFKERLEKYNIKVSFLSRLCTPKEAAEILENLKYGEIDILIGTHKILSKSLEFYDLGLLIIDEEHRFGVEQKEYYKTIKKNIDVLSLSATPIPRTLQHTIINLRSISQLLTAPQNRLPIKTYVLSYDDNLIKEAIQRELSRGGQVYFLHNRKDQLDDIYEKLSKLFPNNKIGIIHGSLEKEESELTFGFFCEGKIQILICTTIIESGLDIPNANTIIVNNADHFGLAQLYQIRGRIGRSSRLAYCYLLVHNQQQITREASLRLNSLKEFTELGSGYNIAYRDLLIRGAGSLIGVEQSGLLDDVGIDLYLELLQQELNSRDKPRDISININKSSYIPNSYSSNERDKFNIYKAILKASSIEQLDDIYAKINDFYGSIKQQEINLLFAKRKLEIILLFPMFSKFKEPREIQNKIELYLSKEYFNYLNTIKRPKSISMIANNISIKLSIDKTEKTWLEDSINYLYELTRLKL